MKGKEIFRPGRVYTVTGDMGDGKTFAAMAMMQHCIEGDYPLDCNVEAITNVKMAYKSAGERPTRGHPKSVHYANSMAETLRTIGEILEKYGNDDVLIPWVADETQNYMMSDQNFSKETQAMKSFLGNTRKFSLCDLFLSPALTNLPLRIRSFPSGENRVGDGNSGYCSGQWLKDRKWAMSRYSKDVALNKIRFRSGPGKPYDVVNIEPTSWTKDPYGPDMKAGQYAYDTRSTATFEVGENEFGVPFDLKEFMKATSEGLYYEVPEQINAFFEKWDRMGSDDDPETANTLSPEINTRCEILYRALSDRRFSYPGKNGVTVYHSIASVAGWMNMNDRSLSYQFNKWLDIKGLKNPTKESDQDIKENVVKIEDSKTQNEPCEGAVYIQSSKEGGTFSPHLASCNEKERKTGRA